MLGERVNVLQIEAGCKVFSGVSSYLLQQYCAMDRERIHYDFLYVKHNSIATIRNNPALVGSVIYSLEATKGRNGRTDFLKIICELQKIVRENRYDIVVLDASSIVVAFACRLALCSIRNSVLIVHAHTSGINVVPGSLRDKYPLLMKIVDQICRIGVCRKAEWLFACTEAAGQYTFGRKAVRWDNYRIVHNAIDLESFQPDPEVRGSVREKNGVTENATVFGYAGRMAPAKNLGFLISVFAELHRRNGNSVLWMVGEGDERKKLRAQAEKLGLGQSVVFFGQRTDVNDLMQGMDAFVFPSLMEGLGMVAIEAQASGLPTLVSDGVPDDVMITPLVRKVSLKASASEWTDAILEQMAAHPVRKNYTEELAKAGYDVRDEARKMMEFYEQIAEQKKARQRRKLEIRIPPTEVELDSAEAVSVQPR